MPRSHLFRAVLLAAAAVPLAAGAGNQLVPPYATFHHFHFRVGDPAAAMNRAASQLSGTRVLLRGIGVGARVGTVYAMFDRLQAPEPAAAYSAADAYEQAAVWLRSLGIAIRDDSRLEASRTAFADMFRSEVLDHVGFTASDLSSAIATMRSQGVSPARQTSDGAAFERAGAVRVELLRDLDAPDAYWCPMHLDVRSSAPGKCPICGMPLVEIPPPRLGEYRMDVSLTPAPGGGVSQVRLSFREPDSGRPVKSLAIVHDKPLHLFIIDRELQFFRHVHPEPTGEGAFELRERIPPGEYVFVADFLPQGGASQMVQRAVVTPGYKGPLFPSVPNLSGDTATERTVEGVRVRLDSKNLKAGREGVLRFVLADAGTGAPVTDLEPFLGAPGHMLIVNADLTEADHVHPEEPAARGPVITFLPLFPAGGSYKLWLQFQRRGFVITVPFVVAVEER